jgi:hypothetical protein
VYFPQDERLARTLLESSARTDSFPWLPRPAQRVVIAIAPDARRFHEWAGGGAPEWGVALAFPASRRILIQGRAAGSDAGDPIETLRHELAHLALHERLGERPPRWFDEGYASLSAREWKREDVLATNVALAVRGTPTLDELEASFAGGSTQAQWAYALSYRAVSELAALDPERGLTLFFQYWENGRNMDSALRQAFGLTLGGFEREYRQKTRRRYGALALVADLSLVFLVLSVLLFPFIVSRRIRDRRKLRALLAADALAEQAERESVLAMLLALGIQPDGTGGAPPAATKSPSESRPTDERGEA